VTIRYDPVSCQLWLDPISAGDRSVQSLCVDHAERLSPPRGWVVVDRRGSQTTIVTAPAVEAAGTTGGTRRVRRRWGSFEAPTLEFTTAEEPEPTPEPEPVPAPVPEPVAAHVPEPESEPVAGPVSEPEPVEPAVSEAVAADGPPDPPSPPTPVADDLGDLLKPRGGLLGRAFESTGPQRSAITLPQTRDGA
jgi:hypothetical protein